MLECAILGATITALITAVVVRLTDQQRVVLYDVKVEKFSKDVKRHIANQLISHR